ncbi:hypothetical protein [Blastococcus sp. CCUG 61487]|nr:hypothetical protein [Blastococcus sp. CCUG 61487]
MTQHHTDPALEAELAYRRERLQQVRRGAPIRRGSWRLRRRQEH